MVTRIEADVLVAGGGPAGIAAAVAAARAGARVVLIERNGVLGGLATAGMVGAICGLYLRDAAAPRYVCGGFPSEWAERLGGMPVGVGDGLYVLPCDPWAFARLADRAVEEAPGLQVILHGVLTALGVTDADIVARALVWDREVVVQVRSVVDCTGEATAVRLAGGRVERPSDPQAAGIVFRMDGVGEGLRGIGGGLAALREIVRAARDGRLPPTCEHVSFVPGSLRAGSVLVKLVLPAREEHWNAMTALEQCARERVEQLSGFLSRGVPHFEGAHLGQVAAAVGIRAGARVAGEATLSEDDVLSCRRFPDGVACGAWPIEEWLGERRPRLRLLPEGGRYEVPMGCLIAGGLTKVFVAGRCISAAPAALASARVIATAMATGWAAGTAAACRAAGKSLTVAVRRAREAQVTDGGGPTT